MDTTRYPITNRSQNGKQTETNHSMNSKNDSKKRKSMQHLYIIHRQQVVFLFETFSEVGRTGEPGIKCYLRYIVVLFFFMSSLARSLPCLYCSKTGLLITVTTSIRKEGSLKTLSPSSVVSASAGS